jgi:hypothetical protein
LEGIKMNDRYLKTNSKIAKNPVKTSGFKVENTIKPKRTKRALKEFSKKMDNLINEIYG